VKPDGHQTASRSPTTTRSAIWNDYSNFADRSDIRVGSKAKKLDPGIGRPGLPPQSGHPIHAPARLLLPKAHPALKVKGHVAKCHQRASWLYSRGVNEASFAELSEWLTQAGLAGTPETDIVSGFCERCVAAGLPLARALMFIDTLHPVHEGRLFRWG